jgi:hypothetical protein
MERIRIESGFFNQAYVPAPLERRKPGMPRARRIGLGAFVIALVASVSVVAFALTRSAADPDEAAKQQRIVELKAELAELKAAIEAREVEPEALAVAPTALVEEPAPEPIADAAAAAPKKQVKAKPQPTDKSVKQPEAAAEVAPPAAPVAAKTDPLDKLINGEKDQPSAAKLPKSLTRPQVRAGMSKVAAVVKSCGGGQGGSLVLHVTIRGDGTVGAAKALGSHAATPVGSCAARYVRRAKFPRFSDPLLRVKYPFAI